MLQQNSKTFFQLLSDASNAHMSVYFENFHYFINIFTQFFTNYKYFQIIPFGKFATIDQLNYSDSSLIVKCGETYTKIMVEVGDCRFV